jgi:hypothetical protein
VEKEESWDERHYERHSVVGKGAEDSSSGHKEAPLGHMEGTELAVASVLNNRGSVDGRKDMTNHSGMQGNICKGYTWLPPVEGDCRSRLSRCYRQLFGEEEDSKHPPR